MKLARPDRFCLGEFRRFRPRIGPFFTAAENPANTLLISFP